MFFAPCAALLSLSWHVLLFAARLHTDNTAAAEAEYFLNRSKLTIDLPASRLFFHGLATKMPFFEQSKAQTQTLTQGTFPFANHKYYKAINFA
jgi:hypothetical protein